MALQVGARLGHYYVTALIGEGGMGLTPESAKKEESSPFLVETLYGS